MPAFAKASHSVTASRNLHFPHSHYPTWQAMSARSSSADRFLLRMALMEPSTGSIEPFLALRGGGASAAGGRKLLAADEGESAEGSDVDGGDNGHGGAAAGSVAFAPGHTGVLPSKAAARGKARHSDSAGPGKGFEDGDGHWRAHKGKASRWAGVAQRET